MTSLLWTKWYFPDWTNDPGLRASSLAARGLWMDMLCIAARNDQPGYVAINGNPVSTDTLARMVGAPVQVVESLVDELERNGVFSRNRTGTIYSRRMVREIKKARTAKENGKKGGNPSLCNNKAKPASDNQSLNLGLNTHIFQEPDIPERNPGSLRSPPPKGRRLPDGWTPDLSDPALSAVNSALVQSELAKFRDYWAAKAGKDAAKLDWQATFRNWMRRATENERNCAQNGSGAGNRQSAAFTHSGSHRRQPAGEIDGFMRVRNLYRDAELLSGQRPDVQPSGFGEGNRDDYAGTGEVLPPIN